MDMLGMHARAATGWVDDSGSSMDDMSGMGHGATSDSSSMSGISTMMSVFQTQRATPLYSTSWTPTSTGTYAATCIFLIVLALVFRGLLAAKAWQESRWLDAELNRRYVVVSGKAPLSETLSRDSLAKKNMVLSENGVEENVMVVKKRTTTHARPWRLSVDPLRAGLDTVIAAVGYLLMLAVMTMNVGYFLSVLGGTFLGSLLVGRYIASVEH
ncbi:low affinity copper transporter [Podospora didyma]|uniref:Copper transport protein n=1 Tax=Podospora didyma TaxID=330526 RepID=A0AAE0P4A5_9PEZI|nr:low affinity copper transporter [Podospora didyma]